MRRMRYIRDMRYMRYPRHPRHTRRTRHMHRTLAPKEGPKVAPYSFHQLLSGSPVLPCAAARGCAQAGCTHHSLVPLPP